jgi:CheY-like chemotaxis protein
MTDKWVMIVDDDTSILVVLKNSLLKLGDSYHVVTASGGAEAMQQIKQVNFDLIVTDYKMAGMNGLELLEQVHNLRPQARVILMTAYGDSSVESEAARLKAHRYISKPIDIVSFRSIVKEAVGDTVGVRENLPVLAEKDYQEIENILQDLRHTIDARCAFLTDNEGRYIARTGAVDRLPLAKIASLLGGCLSTLDEAGKNIDSDAEAINLAYRESPYGILYVVNVGPQFLLIILFQGSSAEHRLPNIWSAALKTVHSLREKIFRIEVSPSDSPIDGTFNEAISDELRKILLKPGNNHTAPPKNDEPSNLKDHLDSIESPSSPLSVSPESLKFDPNHGMGSDSNANGSLHPYDPDKRGPHGIA